MARHKPSGKKKHLSHALKQAQPVPSWVVARTEGKVHERRSSATGEKPRSRCRYSRARKRNPRNRRKRKLPRRKRRSLSKRRTIPFWKNLSKLSRSSLRSKRSQKKSQRRKRRRSRLKRLLKPPQRRRKLRKRKSWKSLRRNSMISTFAEYGMLRARSGPRERSGSSESSYLSE